MTEPLDPFDVIRRLRPEVDRGELQPGVDENADALLQRIVATIEQPPGRHRRRRRLIGGAMFVGLLATGSVAAARWIAGGEPSVIGQITCWGGDTAPPMVQVGLDLPDGADPVDRCAEQWHNGEISRNGPPALISCITDNGIIAVIPTDDEGCERLGLSVYEPTEEGRQALRHYNDLTERINDELDERCLDEQSTRALVDEVLSDDDFAAWQQADGLGFTPERRCGFIDIDAATRIVTVLGLEPAPWQLPTQTTTEEDP